MEKSKSKLQLNQLQVNSFVTANKVESIKGGAQSDFCTMGACQYFTILIGPCANNSGG